MSPSPPFIDTATGSLDTDQIKNEAFPLAGLVALFGGLALIPYVFAFFFANSGLGVLFSIIGQFILAVGAGIVLIYAVARGIQLTDAN